MSISGAVESLRLGDFTQEETLILIGQHTREMGQAFTDDTRESDLDVEVRGMW